MEIWKDVAGYEGLYQVSNYGNVRSNISNRNLSFYIGKKGYVTVHLCGNGKDVRRSIHRLVAEAFIPNPENKPQVNHKDENKLNNNASNLEWCNNLYNCNYGSRNKKISHSRKRQITPICQFLKNGDFVREWESAELIKETLNISKSSIYRCCEGIYSQAGGFVWKYKEKAQ